MNLLEIPSEKHIYLSRNTIVEKKNFLFHGSPYLKDKGLLKFLVRKFFNIQGDAQISVNKYDGGTHFLPERLISLCDNIVSVQNAPLVNSYPPQFGVIITFYQDINKTGYGAGRSLNDTDIAFKKAFGEYLERFYGYFSSTSSALRSFKTPRRFSLSHSSLRVSQLPQPIASQSVMSMFPKSDDNLQTLEAYNVYNVSKSRKELLPLQCLFSNVQDSLFLNHQTSSGGGGGFSQEESKISALYELIERDNFLLHWLAGIAPPLIDEASLSEGVGAYIKKISQRYKLEVHVLDISYDTPIFSCAVSIIDPILEHVVVGTAAGIDVPEVITKALSEALTELHGSKDSAMVASEYDDYIPFSDERIIKETRKNFYSSSKGVEIFRKIFLSGKKVSIVSVIERYQKKFISKKEELVSIETFFKTTSKKKGDGYNLFFLEYQGTLLRKFNYYAHRAYVPSLMKIWLKESLATPWSDRLVEFALSHGRKNFTEKDVNGYPHPLA